MTIVELLGQGYSDCSIISLSPFFWCYCDKFCLIEKRNVLLFREERCNFLIFTYIISSFLCVSRFLFILLGPVGKGQQYHEIGRSMATIMTDEVCTPLLLFMCSSHRCLLSLYSVPGIVLVVGGKIIISGKQCRSCFWGPSPLGFFFLCHLSLLE